MAIDTGLSIACADLEANGGIKELAIREYTNDETIVFGTTHDITSIKEGATPVNADWFVFEFKNETPTLSVTGSKENGSTSFEVGLSFNMPLMNKEKFLQLQKISDASCLMAIAKTVNGEEFVVGISQKYAYSSTTANNQTFAKLSGFEGTSGDAYSSENGITVTLTCKQYELPREYTGTLSVDHALLTATTT